MTNSPTDWDAVARSKLGKILGADKAQQVIAKALASAGLQAIGSADDLMRVAQALKPEGGVVGVTGALLSLHAVIHGDKSRG